MRLDQSVTVPAHVDEVWKLLGDIPTVAACMPGAQLTKTVDDTRCEGTVQIAIGPLAMNYTGVVTIEERDDTNRRIVLFASGRDRRGSGTAKAHVTVRLEPAGDSTDIKVVSDLQLTGRIAGLGRGINDVANRLFVEFADQLAARFDAPATAAVPESRTPSAARATAAASDGAPLKIWPVLVSVTRERLAAFLLRLSERVRPPDHAKGLR